jgi:hypothetical protein
MGVTSVIGYILAIAFGLEGFQPLASVLLLLSLAGTIATILVYRRYARLRDARWQDELKAGEEQIRQVLSEGTENVKPNK